MWVTESLVLPSAARNCTGTPPSASVVRMNSSRFKIRTMVFGITISYRRRTRSRPMRSLITVLAAEGNGGTVVVQTLELKLKPPPYGHDHRGEERSAIGQK
jgi:hypothetical protein